MLSLLQKSIFQSKYSKNKRQLSTAEKKILIIICLFIVPAIFISAQTAVLIATSDKFMAALTNYFKCEALGYVPGKCNRSEFEQYSNPYMSVILYTLLGLAPLGILNFVLKWRSMKKAYISMKSFHHLSRKSFDITNVSSLSLGIRV